MACHDGMAQDPLSNPRRAVEYVRHISNSAHHCSPQAKSAGPCAVDRSAAMLDVRIARFLFMYLE